MNLVVAASEDGVRLRGRWLRLLYSQSLSGQPFRPLVRFHRAGDGEEYALPAAVLGRGAWTWRAPADLERMEILAPEGRDAELRIDDLCPIAPFRIVLGVMRHRPDLLLNFLPWVGTDRGRNVAANDAFHLAAPEEFGRVAPRLSRSVEPQGLDAPLAGAAAGGPRLCFTIRLEERAQLSDLRRTITAFAAQTDDGFRVDVAATPELAGAIDDGGLAERLRISTGTAAGDDAGQAGFVAPLLAGDEPSPEAVLLLRAHLGAHPELDVLYADNALRTPTGLAVQLKPDWSPLFQHGTDYVGRPCLVRASLVEPGVPWRDLLLRVAETRGDDAIGHLKRILFTLAPAIAQGPQPERLTASSANLASSPAPHATLVVPTRDRADLLRRLTDSLAAHTPAGSYDLVLVDNGSTEATAIALLGELAMRPGTQVLRRPGPFNFSSLVNAGAEVAAGPILVLVNNDCEVVAPDWLERLALLAATPGIGAVGALLLYGDDSLQHAGVAIGLGGEAGHRDRKRPRDHAGHLGRLRVPHEVAAVTGACLAVHLDRFREAGGFDEALPVAFNDIDFCLRLLERGHRNLLDPGAVLRHAESASRGRDEGARRARFLAEAALFRERWRELILDDPYLHPMLAMIRFQDRLG